MGKTWIFDPSKLLPGDIVLELGSSLQSKGIALFDGGTYSHALLWLGNTDFIEAQREGARVISFARVVVRKPKRWRLLRLEDDPAGAVRAAAAARNMAHKEYDLRGALQAKAGGRKKPDRTKLFCSQLVAVAYEEAGISIVDGLTTQEVMPSSLENSPKLKSLPLPLLPVSPGMAAPIDRDAGYKDSPMHQEMLASQAVFKAVFDEIGTLANPGAGVRFPPADLYELLEVLARQPSSTILEDRVLNELQQRGYFRLSQGAIINAMQMMSAAVGDIQSGRLSLTDRASVLAQIGTVAESYRDTLDRYRRNGHTFQKIYAARDHQLWLELASMNFLNAAGIESILDTASQVMVP